MAVGITILVFLIRSWHYLWAVLKDVPKTIYFSVLALAILQYSGEHGIGFGHDLGVWLEETSEGIIYTITLVYLIRFPLTPFECCLKQQLPSAIQTPSSAITEPQLANQNQC